ncbi:tyrosine-type recombinase/integrase [Streptantibioticus rubrisoli]|uniref:Tyrosine-type recombinase/integrase n=1 Tax=Streptantibioticus rubrisoli TaxID=1387313 RepID=A0ABT1PEN7_9ACTN|nr:tyrosine-type recombinase/integrase [Streptantibioticus rubrisoli]MCQ4043839.1 tyrosine-type recombinase/integrase [Streptantibioticus rubrisoli]
MADPIKKITLKDGTTRYRFVVDIGRDADGKRKQLTITKDTKKEATAELARIRHQRSTGTFVAPTKMTVNELLDTWLKSATRDVEEGTSSNYDNAVRPVRIHLGHKPLQQLAEEDIESLIDWMLTSGRQRGGKPGTGLGVRSVRLTLGRLRSALNLAVRRGLVVRNVAEHVTVSREAKRKAEEGKAKRQPWNESEVKTFLAATKGHRLYAAMLLALIAERPAEVCGVRWEEDVDLDGEGTITVDQTRTIVYDRSLEKGQRNKVVEKKAKSEAGQRTLPLPKPVHAALRAFRAQQAKEKLAAGEGYESSGYVLVDELGRPWKTDKLRREAYKLMEAAGVRKVRLYDARHACLSWMANVAGVPDTVVSAWAGHSDLSFTKRVYVHPDPQSLKAGSDKLGELLS